MASLLPAFVVVETGRALLTFSLFRLENVSLRPTAVAALGEALKLLVAAVCYRSTNRNADEGIRNLEKSDIAKYAIPALCYLVNTLLYFTAIQKADAALVHVILMAKFPATAILHHFVIRAMRNGKAWMALASLSVGLVTFGLISISQGDHHGNLLAIMLALAAAFLSAFTSVYTEILLKAKGWSFWTSQILLYGFGLLFALPLSLFWSGTIAHANTTIKHSMPLAIGATLLLGVVTAAAGLLVAVILRKKDNLVKLMGNAITIVAIFGGQALISQRQRIIPSTVITAGLVLVSVWAYNAYLGQDARKADSRSNVKEIDPEEMKMVSAASSNDDVATLCEDDEVTKDHFQPTTPNFIILGLCVFLLASLVRQEPFFSMGARESKPLRFQADHLRTGADLVHLTFSDINISRAAPKPLPPNSIRPDGDAKIPTNRYIEKIDPKNVCIMSSDTRPVRPFPIPATYHNIADLEGAQFADLPPETASLYYNGWYAARHGYKYFRMNGPPPKDWYSTWGKLETIMAVISKPECELTVFLDGDAFFMEPSISIQDMLQRWGFHNKMSFLWSGDPRYNFGSANTGFGIFRKTETSIRMLKEVLSCPNDYPGCARFKIDILNEQDAFQEFIRGHFQYGEDWTLSSCYESDGWYAWNQPDDPVGEGDVHACRGSIISHGWWDKKFAAGKVAEIMATEMLAWVAAQYDHAAGQFSWDLIGNKTS